MGCDTHHWHAHLKSWLPDLLQAAVVVGWCISSGDKCFRYRSRKTGTTSAPQAWRWKQQRFHSFNRRYLPGDTQFPLPPLQLEQWHPVCRHQREEGAQVRYLSLLPVSLTEISVWKQSHNCLTLCISYSGTLRCNQKTNTRADRLGSGGSTVYLKIWKFSFARRKDCLHKQAYWQEFFPPHSSSPLCLKNCLITSRPQETASVFRFLSIEWHKQQQENVLRHAELHRNGTNF